MPKRSRASSVKPKTPSRKTSVKPKKRRVVKRSTSKKSTKRRKKRVNAGPITAEEIAETRAKGRVHKCYVGIDSARETKRSLVRDFYVGETPHMIHRRRQHRGEIVGGADKTAAFSGEFTYLLAFRHLLCKRDSTQFEWRLNKYCRQVPRLTKVKWRIAAHAAVDACKLSAKECKGGDLTMRRIARAVLFTLLLDKWTANAVPRDDPLRRDAPALEVHWMVPDTRALGYDVEALVTKHPIKHIFGATAESVDAIA